MTLRTPSCIICFILVGFPLHAQTTLSEQVQIQQRINGTRYGARANETGPIGGGKGYKKRIDTADKTVRSLDQLINALENAGKGDVIYLPGDVTIDCTVQVYIEELVIRIPSGVTLASNRGQNGSPGALIQSDTFNTKPLIRAAGPDVRVSGLRIRGPDPKRRMRHHRRSFQEDRGHSYYYKFPVSRGIVTTSTGLEVDNCELSGWSHAAIFLKDGKNHRIHHNHIHHNQFNGLGYGITHDTAFSRITHNLFNFNRHSIAGTGRPKSGYEASNNVERGTSLSHCFDMHGGRDREDGTNIAGTRIHVHHNTFLPETTSVKIRGKPQKNARIHHNWFNQRRPKQAVETEGNSTVRDNVFGRSEPVVR